MSTDSKKGIIFDMDGVLVDSEPAGVYASMMVINELGVDCRPEEFKEFTGMGDDKFIGGVLEKHGAAYKPEYKERMYGLYVSHAQEKIHVYDWSRKIIPDLHDNGYSVAVASASDYKKVMCNIDKIGVGREYFDAVVTGSDITRNKPAPDIFLKAAEKSGIAPGNCTVIEDSLAGIQAAKTAGMRAVGVTTSFSREKLTEAGADIVVDSLDGLRYILEK